MLGDGLVHLDHLGVEAIASRVQGGSACVLIVIVKLFLSFLLTLGKQGCPLGLQAGLAGLKSLILAGGCRHRLCLVLSGSWLGGRDVSLELLLDFLALHAKDLGE